MPGRVLFKEDFFERVVDVNWESEPKVYWVAGTGAPLIVNGMITGDAHAWAFTSEDGKHWTGTDLWRPQGQGIGAIYAGAWLREGLSEGNAPVWMMAGGSSRTVCKSCACYTTTGTEFSADNKTDFDARHACDGGISSGGSTIFLKSQFNFPNWHSDYFRSSNGRTWTPKNYHGDDEGEGLAVSLAAEVSPPVHEYSPVARFISSDPDDPNSLLVPDRRPLLRSASAPMPLADGSGGSKKADEIVFKPAVYAASGKVRKGPYRGKTIGVEIKPYHPYSDQDAAHGDSTVEVTVIGDDKEPPKTVDTGVTRSMSIGYGYYTFVVGGASGGKRVTTLAWSEDGLQWKKQTFGDHSQINPVIVGPRPKKS